MSQASGRTVFVLGREDHGNRVVHIVESGEEYSVDYESTVVEYSSDFASFPYTAE